MNEKTEKMGSFKDEIKQGLDKFLDEEIGSIK